MKRQLLGLPIDVVLMEWNYFTLGMDYTMWISTAPAYFETILNYTGQYESGINGTLLLLEDGAEGFSVAQSVWAAGQLMGSLSAAPLSHYLGFRFSFVVLTILSIAGNILYGMAGMMGGDAGKWIAWIGKTINGFGDGSLALSLAYITIALFENQKLMRKAVFHARSCMGLGQVIGAAIAIAFTDVVINQAGSDEMGGPIFSGGDLVGWAMAALTLPVAIAACFVIENATPPTVEEEMQVRDLDRSAIKQKLASMHNQKGQMKQKDKKMCQGLHLTRKSLFWLVLVFSYGATSAVITFFLPVFPYCPDYCNELELRSSVELATYINYVTLGAFTAGLLGCMVNSILSASSNERVQEWAGLSLMRAACVLVTISVACMYVGYRIFDTTATEVSDGQTIFIVGVCIYFMATSSLSAGMPSMYKQVLPKSSLATMMPLFTTSLDVGKVIGPLYAAWAYGSSSDVWETQAATSFAPPFTMFAIVTIIIFAMGKFLTQDVEANTKNHALLRSQASSFQAYNKLKEILHRQTELVRTRDITTRMSDQQSNIGLYGDEAFLSISQIADAKRINDVEVSLII